MAEIEFDDPVVQRVYRLNCGLQHQNADLEARVKRLMVKRIRDAEVISQLRTRVAKAEQYARRVGRADLEQTNRINGLEKLVESHPGSGESVAEMKARWRQQEHERARVGRRGEGESGG